jgi:hypothetical protein
MPLLEGEKTEPFAASLNCCVCAPGEPGWAAAAAAISHAPSSSQQRKVRPACLHAREHTQWQGSQVCSCSGGVKELAEVKPMHAAASVTASSSSIVAATRRQANARLCKGAIDFFRVQVGRDIYSMIYYPRVTSTPSRASEPRENTPAGKDHAAATRPCP